MMVKTSAEELIRSILKNLSLRHRYKDLKFGNETLNFVLRSDCKQGDPGNLNGEGKQVDHLRESVGEQRVGGYWVFLYPLYNFNQVCVLAGASSTILI